MNGRCHHQMDYLQYDKVKDKLQDTEKEATDVKVFVYSIEGLMRHVIPNPQKKDKLDGVQTTYDTGFFTRKEVKYVPLAVFEDENNWD